MRRNLKQHIVELIWRLFYTFIGFFLTISIFLEDPYQIVFHYWLKPLKELHIPLVQGDITQLYDNTINFSIMTTLVLICPIVGLSLYLFIKPGLTYKEDKLIFKSLIMFILGLILLTLSIIYLWPYLISLVLDTPQVIRLLNIKIVSEVFKTFLTIPLSLIFMVMISTICSRLSIWLIITIIWGTMLDIWWEGPLILELCHLIYRIWTKPSSLISSVV